MNNLMEQQQLDFNQPVLSVRRFGRMSAETENCKKRTETGSAQINYPIPFYKADLKSGPFINPGTVPFLWEKTPGRPKHERKSLYQTSELPPIAPRLPPGRRRDVNEKKDPDRSLNSLTSDLSPAKNVKSGPKTELLRSSHEGHTEAEGFSSEDDDDAYEDARDLLSRSESDICSFSGLSRMDSSDAILTGTVIADPHAVDFMTGRFLPAANAMASEIPPHSAKKMYIVREQPKQASVKEAMCISTPSHKPNLLKHYMQNDLEEESEEDMDEDDQRNVSSKGCGLLPRFCLLNPVPGLRIWPQAKAKSVRRVPANCSSTAHGTKQITMIKLAADCRTAENHEDRSSPIIESETTDNESSQCNSQDEKQLTGSSIKSKQAMNFASSPVAFKTFQEFLLGQNDGNESHQESPVIEKTLYIDSGHGTEVPSSLKAINNSRMVSENYDQSHDNVDSSAAAPSVCSSARKMENLSIAYENKVLKDEIIGPIDYVETLSVVFHHDSQVVQDKSSVKEELPKKGFTISENWKELELKDQKNQRVHLVTGNKIPTGHSHPQLPLPPPLPNSPSDSWLFRVLPTMSSKNQSSRPHSGSPMQIHNKQQPPQQNRANPKWETMVKTSKLQRGHHRYSEEMLAPIPES